MQAQLTNAILAEVVTNGPERTQAVGTAIGENARPGDLVLLEGELGAGKTCLTQGILWGLGGTEYARSPTFVLMAQYAARLTLYHVDLYRVESVAEAADLGLDEVVSGEGVTVIEWAERAGGLFEDDGLRVRLSLVDENTRSLTLSATDGRYSTMIEAALQATDAK